jgi:hypothetical protein
MLIALRLPREAAMNFHRQTKFGDIAAMTATGRCAAQSDGAGIARSVEKRLGGPANQPLAPRDGVSDAA